VAVVNLSQNHVKAVDPGCPRDIAVYRESGRFHLIPCGAERKKVVPASTPIYSDENEERGGNKSTDLVARSKPERKIQLSTKEPESTKDLKTSFQAYKPKRGK
jgi:hypothetical protein